MGLLSKIKGEVEEGCLVSRITRNRCDVAISDISCCHLVIDLDIEGGPFNLSDKRGDYLFISTVGQRDLVVGLELKSGKLRSISDCVKQLQSCADYIESLASDGCAVVFVPCLVSAGMSKYARERLRARPARVRFRGQSIEVQRMKCGDQLSKHLSRMVDGF